MQLFLRHHALGLSLTPAGRALLRDAKQLMKQAEGLYSAADDISRLPRGELSVGWFSTRAPIVMPEVASAFLKAFPDVRLPPYALFGASHPLARERTVKLSQLAPGPMVLLDMPMSRQYFLALFIRERLEPNIVWSSAQFDVVRTLVANGLGYTLANVRPRAESALDGRRLYRVPLSGDQPPVRMGIATLKELKKTRLVEAFERHCAELISDRAIPGMAACVSPPRRKRR